MNSPTAQLDALPAEARPDARTVWRSATILYQGAQEARTEGAEAFVLRQLTTVPGPTTTDLKERAQEENVAHPEQPSIPAVEVSNAIASLREQGRIAFESGPRNARLWYRVELAEQGGQAGDSDLAELAGSLPGKVAKAPHDLARPYRGQGEVRVQGELAGQGDPMDILHPLDPAA